MMNSRNRFPFTASQWQELEQQALIYKYMASGIPIPPDLLFSLRRSYLDSTLSARLLSHQPQHVGWNYLQMSLGRKLDPEPGRCRRTDGKKWRCSKEAFPDSKYCERHMHRGKNRSRKPVETLKPTPKNTTGLSFQDNNAPVFLDRGASYSKSNNADYRYVYGLKEDVDEHAFFSEPSGTMKSQSASSVDDSWQLTPLTMSSSSSSKQRSCSGNLQDCSHLQLQNIRDSTKQQDLEVQNHCSFYGFNGHDIKCDIPRRFGSDEPQKTMHHFLDEWPHRGRDNSWHDLDEKTSNASSVSTTRLSISIPTPHHDFRTI